MNLLFRGANNFHNNNANVNLMRSLYVIQKIRLVGNGTIAFEGDEKVIKGACIRGYVEDSKVMNFAAVGVSSGSCRVQVLQEGGPDQLGMSEL